MGRPISSDQDTMTADMSVAPVKELAAAVEAALAGGDVLRRRFGSDLKISYKSELDLVTEADTESERAIVGILKKRFPGAGILAEEGGETVGSESTRFIIDPLDGTTNYAHGYPCFAVSIGFERDSRVIAGVVYDPLRGELFTGEAGAGAFLNGNPIRVSALADLKRALLITGFPYDLKLDLALALTLFNRFMGQARAIRRDGSAALDLCYVASGRADGFWEEKLKPWDTAAGSLIVMEAGGRVSDFGGAPFVTSGATILASNGALHAAMLEVLDQGRVS